MSSDRKDVTRYNQRYDFKQGTPPLTPGLMAVSKAISSVCKVNNSTLNEEP